MQPARRRVFCASLADVFDNEVDPQWRDDLFALIHATPHLDWLLLTKRIGNVSKMLPADRRGSPYSWGCGWANVWIGATVCNQDEADRDIPKLLATPAALRFVSIEPLLGPIDFRWAPWAHQAAGQTYRDYLDSNGSVNEYEALRQLDWIIVGGESGPDARPMNPAWARTLRDQCQDAGVPFLFKQHGQWAPAVTKTGSWFYPIEGQDMPQFLPQPAGHDTHDFGQGIGAVRLKDKKAAGRLLDGRIHNQFPNGAMIDVTA